MTHRSHPNGQIVSYQQDDAFYARRAQHHMEKGEYLEALTCYRAVQERNPNSPSFLMELAWIYAQLRFYDLSNELLLRLISDYEKNNAEAYYALGSNFYALGEYARSGECLGIYLHLDPDGVYAEESEYMLAALSDTDISTDDEEDVHRAALMYGFRRRLQEMPESGNLPSGLGRYGEIESLPLRDLLTAYLQIAITYFIQGDSDTAITVAEEILNRYPYDMAALCNLALFYLRSGREKEAHAVLDRIRRMELTNDEDCFKFGVLLCEFGLHNEARHRIQPLLDSSLDAPKVMQYYALACFNAGYPKDALRIWNRMTHIDPSDAVYAYYYRLVASHIRGDVHIASLRYTMQLPASEVLARVRYINERISHTTQDLHSLWMDEEFRSLLIWGTHIGDTESKRAMLHLLATVAGSDAVPLLKSFLLRRQEEDDLKRETIAIIKQMGVPEPYTVLTQEGIVEVSVSVQEVQEPPDISEQQLAVLDGVIDAMRDRYDDYRSRVTALWMRLITGPQAVTRSMRNIGAWQAALEYRYAIEYENNPLTIAEAAFIYDVSPSSVSACLQKIYKKDDEDKYHGPTHH